MKPLLHPMVMTVVVSIIAHISRILYKNSKITYCFVLFFRYPVKSIDIYFTSEPSYTDVWCITLSDTIPHQTATSLHGWYSLWYYYLGNKLEIAYTLLYM